MSAVLGLLRCNMAFLSHLRSAFAPLVVFWNGWPEPGTPDNFAICVTPSKDRTELVGQPRVIGA